MWKIYLIGLLIFSAVIFAPFRNAKAVQGRDMAMIGAGAISVGLAVALIISAIKDEPEKSNEIANNVVAPSSPLGQNDFVPALPKKGESLK